MELLKLVLRHVVVIALSTALAETSSCILLHSPLPSLNCRHHVAFSLHSIHLLIALSRRRTLRNLPIDLPLKRHYIFNGIFLNSFSWWSSNEFGWHKPYKLLLCFTTCVNVRIRGLSQASFTSTKFIIIASAFHRSVAEPSVQALISIALRHAGIWDICWNGMDRRLTANGCGDNGGNIVWKRPHRVNWNAYAVVKAQIQIFVEIIITIA